MRLSGEDKIAAATVIQKKKDDEEVLKLAKLAPAKKPDSQKPSKKTKTMIKSSTKKEK